MEGASQNKKIRDRVDSEGKYGRLKLLVMKKRLHLTYILIGHTRALSNRKRKTVEGTQVPEAALPEIKGGRQTANMTAGVWSRDP